MISFSKLGEYGRFGNQLFQYTYLRTQSKRLSTTFYCSEWVGDKVFTLQDGDEKGPLSPPRFLYVEDAYKHGFNKEAVEIQDGTDIGGYFQSDKFFKKEDATRWFSFNEELFQDIKNKYRDINFSTATAVHVRLGDYKKPSLMFYPAKPDYFKKAVEKVVPQGEIIVFSEDVEIVKKYLGTMPEGTIYISGNKDYEDFFLMTLCRNIICSASSFSWWAAYLNKHEDKKVIIPSSWFIPHCPVTNPDIFVEGWEKMPAHRIVSDNYYVRYMLIKAKEFFGRSL